MMPILRFIALRNALFILLGLSGFFGYSQSLSSDRPSDGPEIVPYSNLSAMGVDSLLVYSNIDSIITDGIKNKAFPGAQVLAAYKGDIIFHQSYGYHTYDSLQAVRPDDLYDLASVTKITGPLPALMKLYDQGKLDLDAPLSAYWKPWRKRKDKANLTFREILAHQAGLEPYIVFLKEVLKNGSPKSRFIRKEQSERFQAQAYDELFVKTAFRKKMHRMINRSAVKEEKTYRYSGLTFLIYPELISQMTGLPYQQYLQHTFYGRWGAPPLVLNPGPGLSQMPLSLPK